MGSAWGRCEKELVRASTINGRVKDSRTVVIGRVRRGESRCVCPYTDAEFEYGDGVLLGPVIPQAPSSFLCAPGAEVARRNSVKLFQDTVDRNCNTCAKLNRIPSTKHVSGLMVGRCDNVPGDHPYLRGDHFLFAPEDWMGMGCYVARGVA